MSIAVFQGKAIFTHGMARNKFKFASSLPDESKNPSIWEEADFKGMGKCIILKTLPARARLLNQCSPHPLIPFMAEPPLPDSPFRWILSNPCWKVMPMDRIQPSAMIEHFCLCSSKVWKSQFTVEHWSVKIPIWGGRGGRRALDVVDPKNSTQKISNGRDIL